MELKEYLLMEFSGLERNIKRVTNGLTQMEVCWRPGNGCNSIGLILYHLARSEDMFVQSRLREATELWEIGQYWEKLKVPKDEAGAHYTPEQVNNFPVSELAETRKYYDAVRAQTVDYVKSLSVEDLDRKIVMGGPFGEMPAAAIFSLIVGHTAQHVGEISYLRGLQRGEEPMGPPPSE